MKDLGGSINCLDCNKRAKCFKKLNPTELEFIKQKRTQIQYRKDENICKQGAFASYVLYVADGLVKIYLEGQGNKNINVAIAQSSEFIGLSAIFGNNNYNYSALALRDSSIYLIEKESLTKLLVNNGDFACEIIKWYCDKEIQLFNKIKSLGHKQMYGRLADVLLSLSTDDLERESVFSYLSRKDIADFACISTESIVRLLTKLKKENIIEIKRKEIKILQMDLLQEISRRG